MMKMNSLRRYFVAGLATLFPVTFTLLVVIKLFQLSEGWAHNLFGFTIPGLGLLITLPSSWSSAFSPPT